MPEASTALHQICKVIVRHFETYTRSRSVYQDIGVRDGREIMREVAYFLGVGKVGRIPGAQVARSRSEEEELDTPV
jgi:hypothetical protein